MRPTFRELKRNAREILTGMYSVMIIGYLFVECISSVLTSLFTPTSENMTTMQYVIYYLAEFIIAILVMVFNAGLLKMVMNLTRKEPVHPRMIFFAFRSQADRFIIAAAIYSIFIIIPYAIPIVFSYFADSYFGISSDAEYVLVYLLLLLLAFILTTIITLRFNFVFQILLDDIYCGALEAFRRSSELMKGNCFRLLLLDCSFIGWGLLGLLSFGIGFLWIIPYYQTTQTYFYYSLTGELNEANAQESEDDYYDYDRYAN